MPTIKKKGFAVKKQPEQEILTIAHTVSAFVSSYKKQFTIAVPDAKDEEIDYLVFGWFRA